MPYCREKIIWSWSGLVKLLSKLFIKNSNDVSDPGVRTAYGILCGVIGIMLNLVLFVIKLLAGSLSGSIAVTADAFNNLSDAGSSIITLFGFKLSGQKPDPQHPFGHGRIEYISGLVVALIIILVGFELGKTSVEKIISPEEVEFNYVALIILVASIGVKLYMAVYNTQIGKKIGSAAMKAVAFDSLSDTIATFVALISMIVSHLTSLEIDGWCGLALAVFILWGGIKAVKDTVSPLLGQPPEKELVDEIEKMVMSYDCVVGMHDLIVHNYGPGRTMISLHAEVSASSDFLEVHDAIDNIERELAERTGCHAVIHMDPIVTDDETTNEVRAKVADIVKSIDKSLSMHDFRMVPGPTHTNLIFDVVVPYGLKISHDEIKSRIAKAVREISEDYFAVINFDRSFG